MSSGRNRFKGFSNGRCGLYDVDKPSLFVFKAFIRVLRIYTFVELRQPVLEVLSKNAQASPPNSSAAAPAHVFRYSLERFHYF